MIVRNDFGYHEYEGWVGYAEMSASGLQALWF